MIKQILTHKIFILLLLSLLLMIPVQFILDLNKERQYYGNEVIQSIMASSSGPQRLMGPIIVQPYTKKYLVIKDNYQVEQEEQGYNLLLPNKLDVQVNMEVAPRKLGIYQAQLYNSRITLSGDFPTDSDNDINSSGLSKQSYNEPSINSDVAESVVATIANEDPGLPTKLILGKPYLTMILSDARGINKVPELKLGKAIIPFAPGARLYNMAGINAPLDAIPEKDGSFHIELDLQGMNQFEVVPLGKDSEMKITSNWPHPNFIGDFLPISRSLTSQGFEANWKSSWFATDMERRFYQTVNADTDLPTFNVSLVQPVNQYQQNERAAKYAVLFIGLTFISFFMFEVLKGLRVHPIQYALVGMGLVIFYLVLLALTEHVGFSKAYLIASIASVILNGFYLSNVLGGLKQGIGFAALLGLVYALLFGLLQAEDIALLLGSLLLFLVLALIMMLTRKLDWYQVMKSPTPAPKLEQDN